MTTSTDHSALRLATRLSFFVAGFAIACWAPLVPFAKARLGVTDGVLAILLLCLGIGSVAAMTATGPVNARFGCRPIILVGGCGVAVFLPLLAIANTAATMGVALALFGACLGSLDVAMNVHAVEVERLSARPSMSVFHAMYSVGGIVGSATVAGLLYADVGASAATLPPAAAMLVLMSVAGPRLLRSAKAAKAPLFVAPRGIVLLLATLAAITFLIESAIRDWGALLTLGAGLTAEAGSGIGYVLFSIAMATGRLSGDSIIRKYGDAAVLRFGGLVTFSGFIVLLSSQIGPAALSGFVMIGLGASNIVPILFRRAGTQTRLPVAFAVVAITTVGYAGVLAGPAVIGLLSQLVGLPSTFGLLGLMILAVPASASFVTRQRP